MFQTTIALKDIRASGTNKIDLGDLSAEDANQRIQELYTFLGGDVTIEVQGGTVTVQADVESELNRQGQRLFDKAIAEANRGRYSAAIRLLEQVLEQAPASGGRLIFHIFGALAEFERNLIRERTMVGLEAARARGRVGGRRKALDEFPRRLQDVRNESRQLVHQNELYWVFSLNKEIDDLVTHLYASKEMVRKYDHLRAQNKITNDKLTCLQDENGEVRRWMRLLREKRRRP